jgi:hypothetical protein
VKYFSPHGVSVGLLVEGRVFGVRRYVTVSRMVRSSCNVMGLRSLYREMSASIIFLTDDIVGSCVQVNRKLWERTYLENWKRVFRIVRKQSLVKYVYVWMFGEGWHEAELGYKVLNILCR